MPTLDDLRATLHDRAESCDGDAFTALVLTARPNRALRRRLAAPLLAAAAVVAAVGAAAAVGTTLRHDGGTPAARPAPRPAPSWQFTIADVPGWTVSYDLVGWTDGRGSIPGAWGESAMLTADTGRATVAYGYEPRAEADFPGNGMNVAISEGRATAVTVNGQPGWWAPGRRVDTSIMTPSLVSDPWAAVKNSGDWQPYLAWKNADGSWNGMLGTVGFRPKTFSFDNAVARKTMMRIAKAVSIPSSGGPVTLPFVAHFDSSYQLSEVSSQSDAACGEWATAAPVDDVRICRVTPAEQYSERLGLSQGDEQENKKIVRRDLGDGSVLVAVLESARRDLTTAKVLDSVDVSPKLGDRSTWLPVGS